MRTPFSVVVLCGSTTLSSLFAVAGCSGKANIHDTDEAKNNACVSCHRSAFNAAVAPKHDGLFQDVCNDCHLTKAWAPIPVLHELTGVLSKPCVRCHGETYDATTKPKHVPNFPRECKDCHATKGWQPLARDIHLTDTVKSKKCFDCHQPQFVATVNPKHDGVLPTTCETCHGTAAWKPSIQRPVP